MISLGNFFRTDLDKDQTNARKQVPRTHLSKLKSTSFYSLFNVLKPSQMEVEVKLKLLIYETCLIVFGKSINLKPIASDNAYRLNHYINKSVH